MANSNAPTGLTPVRYASGAPYNGASNVYYAPASDSNALYIGDPVIIAGSADTDGVPSITIATAGASFTGVVVGFKPDANIVANGYRARLEEKGLLVSGKNVNKETGLELVEMVEIPGHPWFLGCQFHPEFLSRPLQPHPLFSAFIRAAKESGKGAQRALKGIQ